MSTSENQSPVLRSNKFKIGPWDGKDFVVLLVNGALLLFIVVCSGKLVIEMLLGSMDKKDELWITIILTGIAYLYSFLFGYGSVKVFEKGDEITNITQFLRFYAFIYFCGFGVIYWVVILKLAERDYIREDSHRYLQYIVILALCYIAVRMIAIIPKAQDVWLLAAVIFISNLVHTASIIYQYIFSGANDFSYFIRDLLVLILMALAAVFTLFGSWKAPIEKDAKLQIPAPRANS